MIPLYHGTTDKVLAKIKEKGLVARAAPGGTEFARRSGILGVARADEKLKNREAVYLTPAPSVAIDFAEHAVEINGGNPIVLEITIPGSIWAKMAIDTHFCGPEESCWGGGLTYSGVVKPQWIKRVMTKDDAFKLIDQLDVDQRAQRI